MSIPAALVFLVVAGCGVRTAPRAPEDTAAAAPDEIQARSTPRGVTITWSRPTKTVDRSRLYDLATFVVERSVDDGAFVPIATIDVTDQDRIRPQQSFRYVDDAVPPGTVQYRVRAVTEDGEPGIATEPARPAAPGATAGTGAATAGETPTK